MSTAVHLDRPMAWLGGSLLLTDEGGACGGDVASAITGLFVRETRHLSLLRLEVNGELPWWCERARPSTSELAFVLVHPELTRFGGGGSGASGDEESTDVHGVPHRAFDLRLRYTLEPHRLRIELVVTNRARRALRPEIAFRFDADYADLLEAVDGRRQQEARVDATAQPGALRFDYRHARLPFATTVQWQSPGEVRAEPRRWSTRVTLAPQEAAAIALAVEAVDPDLAIDEPGRAARRAHVTRWREERTRILVPGNPLAERVLQRAADDFQSFAALEGPPAEWLSLHAGVPLYPAFFARDALTAGWQAALLDRARSLDASLVRLGRLQTDCDDPWREEEPGRIPYQVRAGPLARLDLNPYAAYYADFASPLMFVIAVANLFAWTGERDDVARHWPAVCRILDWAREHGDRDGDGFLEYRTRDPDGTKNQGWKDSGDAIVYDDGTPVPAPIATCELQGYSFAAQQLAALLALVLGERRRARSLWRSARALRRRFDAAFWDPGEGFYGLALDAEKRLVRAPSSNVGHCLASGIVPRSRRRAVVARLLRPDLWSGWGIRTLSSAHRAYDPLSYHRGSVWAVENATIAFGMRRMGFVAAAAQVTAGMFALATLYPDQRIPECVGGYGREQHPAPGAYPRANTPQLWNASAFLLLVQTMLGLLPYAAHHVLVCDARLPPDWPSLEMHGLRVGDTTASLRFRRRARGAARVEVLAKDGPLHLLRQPPPEAPIGLGHRLRALLRR